MKPLCSPTYATCCAIYSVCGILFLGIIGILFDIELHALTESTKYPDDPHAVAKGCYIATAIYVGTLALSLCQTLVHRRNKRVAYAPVPTHQ